MDKIWSVIGRKQASVASAATILMCMVLTSRILGLVRDRLLSARFAPEELGVYFAAFRIPNVLFELLVMGAFTSAFIPVFTSYVTKKDDAGGWQMTSILINITLFVLLIILVPIVGWAEPISRMMAPGFSDAQIAQMAQFTRFMVVFQVIPLLVGNFFTGVLQSYQLFLIPAFAPVVYNVGIIIGIMVFSSTWGLFAPVFGVGLGSVLFMIIQVPLLWRVGYRHRFSMNLSHAGVREVAKLIGPRTFGLAVAQIDTTVDLILASLLGSRMVTVFSFAQHLQQLPVGLFGASIAQAALPTLSKASAKEDVDHFRETIVTSMHQILFFVFPASVFFIVLRVPVVRLVFGAARFDWDATVLTGLTLTAFCISLFAQSIVHVLARAFYAMYDTKTPVITSVISILCNTLLSVVFITWLHWPVWALGLSTSVASILNAALLFVQLDRRIGHFPRVTLLSPIVKMFVASITSGFAVYVPLKLFDQLIFDTTRITGLLFLTGLAGLAGIVVYTVISWLFNISEVVSFFALLRRVRRGEQILFAPAQEAVGGSASDAIT